MTTRELVNLLNDILAAHPEAEEARVWASSDEVDHTFPLRAVGFSKKHKPARVKLEG